ncbi:hypothetical protein TIFTF001_044658 [Ficus carica]|uniref:Uncharacterized protein n=1 Tax=Ficus carica TaxID=3494 RepID=A0AA87ZGD1_FICCA|nr:hypothetical protein TIFTF001_044658 [Ficus carica]
MKSAPKIVAPSCGALIVIRPNVVVRRRQHRCMRDRDIMHFGEKSPKIQIENERRQRSVYQLIVGGFQRSVSGVVLVVMCRKRMNDIREESEVVKDIYFSYESFFIGCYGTHYISGKSGCISADCSFSGLPQWFALKPQLSSPPTGSPPPPRCSAPFTSMIYQSPAPPSPSSMLNTSSDQILHRPLL